MNEASNAIGREFIIPHGACVDEERELFAAIDAGAAQQNRQLLSIAEQACLNCVQMPVCNPHSREIASVLGHNVFIGGQQVTAEPLASAAEHELDIAALPFDLRQLPVDPHLALTHLRRGVRRNLFVLHGPRPTGLPAIGGLIIGKLAECAPQSFKDMSSPKLVKPADSQQALDSISLVLCQQADFVNFTTGNTRESRRTRYLPEYFKLEDNFPIICEYFEDVVELARNGFRIPAKQALGDSAINWQQRASKYIGHNMTATLFHAMASSNWHNPDRKLEDYTALLDASHLRKSTVSEASLRVAALRNKVANPELEKALANEFAGTHIRRSMIGRVIYTAADPQEALRLINARIDAAIECYGENHPYLRIEDMQDIAVSNTRRYLYALERYISNVEELVKHYGNQPELTLMKIRGIAKSHPNDPLEAAQNFIAKRTAAKGGKVMPVQAAIMGGSPEQVQQKYRIAITYQRLSRRHEQETAKETLEQWMIARIAACYRPGQFDKMAEQLYALMNEGVLTTAFGAPAIMQDLNFQTHVNAICDPATGKYVTFAIPLEPFERLALAKCKGMDEFFYGTQISEEFLSQTSGIKNWQGYIKKYLLPKVDKLARERRAGDQPAVPPSLSLLSEDMLMLKHATADDRPIISSQPIEFSTVVGAEIIEVVPGDFVSPVLDASAAKWIQQVILARYRADAEEALYRINQAFTDGILELSGQGAERVVLFSRHIRQTAAEYERAMLAHRLGVDRLLYGRDMGAVLRVYEDFFEESNIVNDLASPVPRPHAVRDESDWWEDEPASKAATQTKATAVHQELSETSAPVLPAFSVVPNNTTPPTTATRHGGTLSQSTIESWHVLVRSKDKKKITHKTTAPFEVAYALFNGDIQTITIPPNTEFSIFFRPTPRSKNKTANTLGTFFLPDFQVTFMLNGKVRIVPHKE